MQDNNSWYCSELVDKAYLSERIDLLPDEEWIGSPQDISESNLLKLVSNITKEA